MTRMRNMPRIFERNITKIDDETALKLLMDLTVTDMLKETRQFNENDSFFKGDVVYRRDPVSGLHRLYICKVDVTTGPFNPDQWEEHAGIGGGGGAAKEFFIMTTDWTEVTNTTTGEVTYTFSLNHNIGSKILTSAVYNDLNSRVVIDEQYSSDNVVILTSLDSFNGRIVISK